MDVDYVRGGGKRGGGNRWRRRRLGLTQTVLLAAIETETRAYLLMKQCQQRVNVHVIYFVPNETVWSLSCSTSSKRPYQVGHGVANCRWQGREDDKDDARALATSAASILETTNGPDCRHATRLSVDPHLSHTEAKAHQAGCATRGGPRNGLNHCLLREYYG